MSELISEVTAPDARAVMVIFGGNPHRRHEVLTMIRELGGITARGALSEEEGMTLLASLPRVDLVMIGGRYDEEQRARIRAHVRTTLPHALLTEPGHDYPYENEAIVADLRRKLGP